MSDNVYRYSWTDNFNNTYQFELMIGSHLTITPNYIDLEDPAFVSCLFSGEQDDYSGIKSVLGIPTANVLNLTLNLNEFTNTVIEYFYNGTSTSTDTLTLYTGYSVPFNYENTIILKKNGTTIFYGVQEIEDEVSTNADGHYEMQFVCMIAKSLQKLECSDEGLGLTDNSTVQIEPSTIPTYEKVVETRYNFDFFYLSGSSVRGSIFKQPPANLYAYHRWITFKHFFESISGLATVLATAWRRGSTTITIDNPMTNHTFYKIDEGVGGGKGSALTENELGFVYAIAMEEKGTSNVINQDGLLVNILKYDSVWELLRDYLEGWAFRSKFDYSTLTLEHSPFKDTTDKVTFNSNIDITSDLSHHQLKFVSINSTFKGNLNYDGAIGISKNEVLDITVTNKTNNNGNLQRFELYPIFHTCPVGVTDHRVGKWWASKCYNHGSIGYLRIVSYSGSSKATIIRAYDAINFKYASASTYEPTPHADVLDLPNAESSSSNGNYVGKYMTNWTRKRLSNSTSPVITNHVLATYLQSPSLTFEFQTDQDLSIEDLGKTCEFSDLSFLPAYSNISVDVAFITKIEYDFESGVYNVGVTLAN